MECSEVRNILLENKYISEIEIEQNKTYKDKSYNILIYCKLEAYGKWIPIIIGIPKDWEINLFDFYWEFDFPYIPHLDNKGKFCLYDLEGVLIDKNFQGLLNQCVDRARTLVKNGESGNNKGDYLSEFDSYFALLPDCKIGKVVIPKLKENQNIKFYEKIEGNRKKNETYAQYKKRQQNISYFASYNHGDFKTWKINGTQRTGLYFYIEPTCPIYPPNYLDFNGRSFINNLFNYIDIKTFTKLKNACKQKFLIIFEIKQDEDNSNCFGFIIERPIFKIIDKVELYEFDKLTPLLVNRIDTQYLSNRTSFSDNDLAKKSYLLIGCGSIGGYVFHNLIKSGCKEITIIDNDKMKEENIYRHFLGAESVGMYKSVALANYAERTIPELNIKTIEERIEDAIEDCEIDFNDYDYIISAIGNHTVNLWINRFFIDNKISKNIFYIWNEALDIGCHVALINTSRPCDYEDLFSRDESGRLFDLTSFCMRGQIFTKSYSGCTGTFIPYGSSISLNSSLLFMDILRQAVFGRIESNVLCSEKGDDYYFKLAGFKVSDRFEYQRDKRTIIKLEDMLKKG